MSALDVEANRKPRCRGFLEGDFQEPAEARVSSAYDLFPVLAYDQCSLGSECRRGQAEIVSTHWPRR